MNRFFSIFFPSVAYADTGTDWSWGFQDPASPIMEAIIDLHHSIFAVIVVILTFVLWLLIRTLMQFIITKNTNPSRETHGTVLEVVWTLIPAIILGFIAVPSFVLLYSMDEIINPAITVKAIGHQWYWSYEIHDGDDSVVFDSYMIPDDDLEIGQLRLLEVDNSLVLPIHTHIRMLITATDVLHSWAVPSLGIKIDAVPGRLNQTSFFMTRPGVFRGQCSELCGVGHGFMPIVVEGVDLDTYLSWLSNQ